MKCGAARHLPRGRKHQSTSERRGSKPKQNKQKRTTQAAPEKKRGSANHGPKGAGRALGRRRRRRRGREGEGSKKTGTKRKRQQQKKRNKEEMKIKERAKERKENNTDTAVGLRSITWPGSHPSWWNSWPLGQRTWLGSRPSPALEHHIPREEGEAEGRRRKKQKKVKRREEEKGESPGAQQTIRKRLPQTTRYLEFVAPGYSWFPKAAARPMLSAA